MKIEQNLEWALMCTALPQSPNVKIHYGGLYQQIKNEQGIS